MQTTVGKNATPNRGENRLGTEALGVTGHSAVKVSLALVEFSMHSCFVPQFTCLQSEVTALLPSRHDQ